VPTYDAKGNLTSAGTPVYVYSTKNELMQRTDTGATFYHDPLGRLDDIIGGSQGFQYDGEHISTQILDASPFTIQRRYVRGTGADEPLVWYEGADFSNKRYLIVDERGSVIAVPDSSGNPIQINSYNEYASLARTIWPHRLQIQTRRCINARGLTRRSGFPCIQPCTRRARVVM